MGNDECKIHLDAMREVYMLLVLNLKMSYDRYPPHMGNPHNEVLKIEDLVLIKNQTPQSPFNMRYKPSYRIINRIVDKSFDMQNPTGQVKEYLHGTYNSCTQQNSMWQLFFKWRCSEELQNSLTTPV